MERKDLSAASGADRLEQVRAVFARDRFATMAAGAEIVCAEPPAAGEKSGIASRVVCAMALGERHLNAYGGVMGGAIFTLADFVFAVASNAFSPDLATVAISGSVRYLAAAKGTKLIATGRLLRAGRTTVFYDVDVADDTGRAVAEASFVGHRSPLAPPPSP